MAGNNPRTGMTAAQKKAQEDGKLKKEADSAAAETETKRQQDAASGALSSQLKEINEAGDLTPEEVGDKLNDLVGADFTEEAVRQELLNYVAVNAEFSKGGDSNLNKYITEKQLYIDAQAALGTEKASTKDFKDKYLKDNIDTSEQKVSDIDATGKLSREEALALTRQTHQCILMHYLGPVADHHRRFMGNDFYVANIAPNDADSPAKIILVDDNSPDSSVTPINSLTSLGKTDVDGITPAQLASIIPSLRLYKIYREGGTEKSKVEFKFSNKTDSGFLEKVAEQKFGDFIMDAGYAKGRGAGIKSFNWSFIGGDPFTATRDLTATLKIFFQDFRDLTEVRTDSKNLFDLDSDNPEYKYLDLVLQADCRDSKKEVASNEVPFVGPTQDMGSFNPECYEIAVEVGYAPSPDLPKGLENQSDTLYLTMVEHSFDIGQDGTFELTIDYRARLASLLGDKGMNVLAPAGGHMAQNDFNGKALTFDISLVEEKIKEEEKKRKADEKYETEELEALKSVKSHLLYLRNNSLYRSISDTLLREELTYRMHVPMDTFANFSNFDKYDRDNEIVGIDARNAWEPKKGDIITLGATSTGIGAEELEQNIAFLGSAPAITVGPGASDLRAKRVAVAVTFKENIYFTTVGNLLAVALEHVLGEGSFVNTLAAGDIEELTKIFKAAQGDNATDEEKEAAEETTGQTGGVQTKGDVGQKTAPVKARKKVDVKTAQREVLKRFRVILGAVTYIDAVSGSEKTINLAHLPVSMQMFRKFMIDRVIAQNRGFYSLQDFVKDILTDIVLDSLNRICFGGYTKSDSRIRAGISLISGQGTKKEGDWKEPISSSTEEGIYEIRNGSTYKVLNTSLATYDSPIFTNIKTNKAKEFNYLMFSAFSSEVLNSRLHGDKAKDADNGIPHFRYGSTTGLLKSVSFTKSPIEYLAEERYVREGSDNLLNQLAGRYEMQMNLVGNNMFIPGQYVYFDPVALGIGKSYANNTTTRSLANLMGLGGYHLVTEVGNSISPGKFETTIKALWETGGSMPPNTDGA